MTGENDVTEQQQRYPSYEEQKAYWNEREKQFVEAESNPTPFTCPTCLRQFKSPKAVAMHVARVHTKTILAPREKPEGKTLVEVLTESSKPKRKWSLARRRRYNAKKKAEQEALESPKVQERTESWERMTPQLPEEALIRFCPCCGKNIERWLS